MKPRKPQFITWKALKDQLSSNKLDYRELLKMVGTIGKTFKQRFLVKTGSAMHAIEVRDIAYFFSEDKLSFALTKKKQKYVIKETLDEVEELVDPTNFFRINRQFILNIDSIIKVHAHFNGRLKVDVVPEPSERIYISNRRATPFKQWMNK